MPKRPPADDHSATALGLLAVVGAAACWGIAAAVAKGLFEEGVEPIELAQARSYVAAVGFSLLPGAWAGGIRMDRATALPLIGLGLSIPAVNGVYYLAIQRLDVAVALVMEYSAPVLVVAWTAVQARRFPRPLVLATLTAAIVGVVGVAELPKGDVGTVDGIGLALGMAAAVFFSAYTLLNEATAARLGPVPSMARAFAIAAAFWVVYQAPRGFPHALVDPDNVLRVLFIGVGGTLVPFLLFIWGVSKVKSEKAAIAATIEPPLAGVIAWLWLGERLSAMQVGGGVLILAAVAALQLERTRPVLAPEP
ncbi:MAG TPA: EamA family transporter [Actinomycetota bacterium]|nr:EamA family transporter [Actinomycetota bacterium]